MGLKTQTGSSGPEVGRDRPQLPKPAMPLASDASARRGSRRLSPTREPTPLPDAGLGKLDRHMPPNYRQQQGQSLTRNERRGFVVLGAAVLLVGLGIGGWAVAGLGGARSPQGPCVSAVIASSTGGGGVHFCGNKARSWCASETRGSGAVALEAQRACRRAGLLPAA